MAKVHVLRGKRGDTLLLTLNGKILVTGEGDGAVEQTFPSSAAAVEHLERVLGLRRREGYVIAEVREPAAAEAASPDDPLAGVVELDAARRRAIVTFKGAKVAAGLCARVVARLEKDAPRAVHVLCDLASPDQELAAAFAGKSLPSIAAFVFDTHFQTVTRQGENACGDLAVILAALPSAARVFATGAIDLTGTAHEALRELYLLADPLPRATATGLGACRFPALETLGLALCSDGGPGPDRAVVAALRSLTAPSLRALHVDGLDDVTSFLQALTASPLPASWRTLRLGGAIDDEDELLTLLKARAPVLRTLTSLGLPLADNISDEAMVKARALVKGLVDRGELPDVLLPSTYDGW